MGKRGGERGISGRGTRTDLEKSLTPEEQKQGVKKYQEADVGVNKSLRSGVKPEDLPENEKFIYDSLKGQMTKLPEDKSVFRNLGRSMNKELDNVKVGDIITDLGFGSTTEDPEIVSKWRGGGAEAYIHLPKGTDVVDMNKVTDNDWYRPQKEFVVDSGARYEVLDIDKSMGTYNLELKKI